MSWYALENLDEAMEKTKDLLLPFDLITWTKIAIIAVFAAGVGLPSAPSVPPQGNQGSTVYTPDSDFQTSPNIETSLGEITGTATAGQTGLAAVIIIVALLFAGLFMYISSVFQFIYYQTVLDGKPSIIKNFRKHAYRGLRYLGFQIVFFLFVLATLVIPAAGFTVNAILGLLLLILVWLPLVIAAALLSGLVHDIALLRMMEAEEGLIEAWRNVWPDIKSQWRQVAVYIVIKFFIGLGIGIATFMVLVAVGIFLLVPFAIVGFLASMVHPILLALTIITGALTFAVIMAYVRVPFSTYLYTYITLFYHDITS